ncbi:hypothetical protein PpBr36_02721 [Pyricularia pennisetigena]|uniref:hypothetical protein n=1 Tax=Pyricularia pennisetigena TaxID=1578925 RepID=UPI001152B81E|nr:hypothetical protein PpBr36_02721 [Pyricularia pennisetigena]TLS31514.1 hypothetical protein PpBr36_02721 [Pyricularia pennisetigena]
MEWKCTAPQTFRSPREQALRFNMIDRLEKLDAQTSHLAGGASIYWEGLFLVGNTLASKGFCVFWRNHELDV